MERGRPVLHARLGPTASAGAPGDGQGAATPLDSGVHRLDIDGGRPAQLWVPSGIVAGRPAPLLVLLHGAGGDPARTLSVLGGLADEAGVILLAPASVAATWDLIAGGWGPDVARLDATLEAVNARLTLDPERVAIGGFSDGASYAVSLGLSNGELFRRIVALSPGFAIADGPVGRPSFFVSHGTEDRVLPISMCSRPLVAQLRAAGYEVEYHEFDGGHTVPIEIAARAVAWLTRA